MEAGEEITIPDTALLQSKEFSLISFVVLTVCCCSDPRLVLVRHRPGLPQHLHGGRGTLPPARLAH